MILHCIICQKQFSARGKRKLTAKYCSSSCYWGDMKGIIPWNKGKKTGQVPKTAYRKGDPRCIGNKHSLGRTPWNKGLRWEAMRGASHPNWKGGKPKVNRRETMTYEQYRQYLDWQKAVFKRDGWNCQFCGKHGGLLHADHIKSWASFPKLRVVVSNGRTLCPPCHQTTPTYGRHADVIH